MRRSESDSLKGWIPIYLSLVEGLATAELAHARGIRFTSSFFLEDSQRILRKPFNSVFRRNISIEELTRIVEEAPGVMPTGFIFHLSRCGSTLFSQALASSTKNIVLSEPEPLDMILSARFNHPWVTEEMQVAWLRAVAGKLFQPRFGESRGFVKFDSWHTLYLPLIAHAFPDVPMIFLYRDPVEILASQMRLPGMQSIRGGKVGMVFGITFEAAMSLSPEEYCATILARTCASFLDHYDWLARERRVELVNYTQLPEYLWENLPEVFDLSASPEELQLMRDAAKRDAKQPTSQFEPDTLKKQRGATDAMRRASQMIVQPYYEQLEAIRTATQK